jgi:TonB family protein
MLQAAEASISSGSRQVLSIAMAENYSNLGRRIMRMMHARYRVSERHGLAYFAAVLILAFFCAAVSAQGPQTSADPSTRPLMMYSEFEKMVSEAVLRSGIPESVIADVLKNFKEANDARILHPQEWRSSILNLLYSKSIPYDLAVQFLSSIPSKPLDIGYLDKLRSAKGNDSGIYPVLIGPVYTMNDGLVPLKPPTVTYQPLPQYTDEARQARVEGIILIQAIVRKDGAVVRPVILKGLGYGLDEAAIDTITTQWRFEPGTLNGTPVSVLANIELSFKLY